MSFKDRFRSFMNGRYGIDALGKALVVGYLVLMLLNVFFLSKIIYIISMVMILLFVIRALSKDTAKRYNENLKFLQITSSVRPWFSRLGSRIEQNKTHCFKRCPNCGKTLRLPRKRGKHGTRCPLCGCEFSVKVWF